MTGKSPIVSKTLWVNVLAIAATVAQAKYGFVVGPEYQAAGLSVINLILRAITKDKIDWSVTTKDQSGRVALIMMPAIAIIMTGIMFMAGCANFKAQLNDPLAEVVVRATTARVLAEHPTWTDRAVSITGSVLAVIEGDPLTSLDALEQEVVKQINWDKLLPEEQALLQVLISQVVEALEQRLAEEGLSDPGQYMMPVRQVLLWINQTASLRG